MRRTAANVTQPDRSSYIPPPIDRWPPAPGRPDERRKRPSVRAIRRSRALAVWAALRMVVCACPGELPGFAAPGLDEQAGDHERRRVLDMASHGRLELVEL